MKYRVFNNNNYSERLGQYLPTYFKTKKQAVAYAETLGGEGLTLQRRCVDEWYTIPLSH